MTKNRSAFTLVELLIASAIFLVVVLTVYSAFYTGVFGYRDIEANIDTYQSARHILERINLDLRNSVAYSQNESKFTGTNGGISFFALVDTFTEGKIMQDYAFIAYNLEDKSIMRLCLSNKEALSDSPKRGPEEIGSEIEELSFSYGYISATGQSIEWRDLWDDPAALPVAVKLKLKIKDRIEKDFERIIFLPLTNLNAA